MSKDLNKIIAENSDKLTKMIEENKPYDKIIKQSQLLDDYITEYYNKNK